MLAWLKLIFDRGNDPVYSCDLYRDKDAGSCAHVDGPLCDFPKCSMLADYRQQKEGMTIAGNGASELGKLMREQHGKDNPHCGIKGGCTTWCGHITCKRHNAEVSGLSTRPPC